MQDLTCSVEPCARPPHAKGMCPTHYSAYWRNANGKSDRTLETVTHSECLVCGRLVNRRGGAVALHSECRYGIPAWMRKGLPEPVPKATPVPTVPKPPVDQRSAIRAAYEDGNREALLAAIKANTIESPSGCWEWARRIDRRGYALIRIGTQNKPVHRLSIEAHYGKPLGVLNAHHICANTKCVNPEHLQPVTHRENMAEMLTRNSLEARIAELEAAVREIDPLHEVLNRIGHLSPN